MGDNSVLRIGVGVGDFNDRQIVNSAYTTIRLYTDLQINPYCYYIYGLDKLDRSVEVKAGKVVVE